MQFLYIPYCQMRLIDMLPLVALIAGVSLGVWLYSKIRR